VLALNFAFDDVALVTLNLLEQLLAHRDVFGIGVECRGLIRELRARFEGEVFDEHIRFGVAETKGRHVHLEPRANLAGHRCLEEMEQQSGCVRSPCRSWVGVPLMSGGSMPGCKPVARMAPPLPSTVWQP